MQINPARNLIQAEETDYKSAVSESVVTRIGASLNHIMLKQWLNFDYKLNGSYQFGVNETNLDGMFIFPVDCEVGFIAFSNAVSGVSGTTRLNVRWFSNSGINEGSIFSTRPAISSAAPNNAYLARDILNLVNIGGGGAGVTTPVLSKTTFLAGQAIAVDLDEAMNGGENFSLTIYFRPI
jgi:hypothetical protein